MAERRMRRVSKAFPWGPVDIGETFHVYALGEGEGADPLPFLTVNDGESCWSSTLSTSEQPKRRSTRSIKGLQSIWSVLMEGGRLPFGSWTREVAGRNTSVAAG
jgi:hypothetical protein